MYGLKRPSNKDTEEDLLNFQKEFVDKLHNDPDFKSNMSVELIKQQTPEATTNATPDNIQEEMEMKFERHDQTLPSLLRKVTETPNLPRPVFPQESNLPFPKAIGVDLQSLLSSAVTDTQGKKKSLFALHMEKQALGIVSGDKLKFPTSDTQQDSIRMDTSVYNQEKSAGNFLEPSLITGEGLAGREIDAKSEIDKIHQENLERLARMSKDEILEEQEKIRTSLDPNLLDFLKNRKRKQNTTPQSKVNISKDEKQAGNEETLDSDGDVQGIMGEAKKQKWQHFDILESEKLEWIQKKNEHTNQASKPRFDFSGKLTTRDDVIKADTGLFHHGEDSDHPGYTLEELIHLSDSSFQSQKMLSLQTLACIAKSAQNENSIHQKLEANLLKIMIDIGVPMIFRIAMDNTTLPIMCIGILGIRNLLVNTVDIEFLRQIQYTSLGLSLPLLNSTLEPVVKDSEEGEIADMELIQQDLVQGLLKTNILTRIRYILDTIRPPDTSVICCLEILIHFARYAKSIAVQVANNEKLLKVILTNFLPFHLSFDKAAGSYGQPCVEAIHFCYYLIQISKNSSMTLAVKHGIIEKLIQFVLLDQNEFSDKKQEITKLIVASLQTLRCLACYGIGLEYFQSGYERFISKLQSYYGKYTELSEADYNCLTSLIQYITEIALALAFSREHRIELLNPVVQIIQGICEKATLAIQIEITISQQRILSAIYNLFSTLIRKSVVSKFTSPVELISSLETFTTVQHSKFCHSKAMKQIFTSFMQYSASLDKCTTEFYVKSLLMNVSTERGYIATSDLIYSLVSFNDSASKQLAHLKIKPFLNITGLYQLILNYFQNLVTQNNTQAPTAFFLLEVPIIYKLLESSESELGKSPREKQLTHNLFFCLTTWLHPGQEYFLKDIFDRFIFSPKYYGSKEKCLTSEELKSISFTYNTLLQFVSVTEASIDHSNRIYNRNRIDINSLTLPSFHSPILPIDWLTMPIFVLYNKEESKPNIPGGFQTNVRFLTDCLKFYNYVELDGTLLLDYTQPSARVARIMLAFLLGDMFLTDEINTQLSNILELYSKQDFIDRLDFSGPIQGVADFVELYAELCAHFTSVSFGDPTYALFLLIPLLSNPSTHIKLVIWKNNMEIFRLFPIPITAISLPIYRLLSPRETDTSVLASMVEALIREKVRLTWSPVFYLMAVHHVRSYIRREPKDSNEKSIGVNLVYALLNASESLFHDFVGYSEELSVSSRTFKKSELSSNRLLVNSVYEEVIISSELFKREAPKFTDLIDFV